MRATALASERPRAVIVLGSTGTDRPEPRPTDPVAPAHPDSLRQLTRAGIRVILCLRPRPSAGPDVVSLDADQTAAGEAAVRHLLQLGHRRIAFVGHRAGHPVIEQRFEGARALLDAAGGRLVAHDAAATLSGGRRAASDVVALGVTAAVGAGDDATFGLLAGLRDLGRRVPHDLSVVSIDDTSLARSWYPAPTAVHIPYDRIGRRAAELATGAFSLPAVLSERFPVELTLRLTTAHPAVALR